VRKALCGKEVHGCADRDKRDSKQKRRLETNFRETSGPIDFRLLQQYLPKAVIRAALGRDKPARSRRNGLSRRRAKRKAT